MDLNFLAFRKIVMKDSKELMKILLDNNIDLDEEIKNGNIEKFWESGALRWGLTFVNLRGIDLRDVPISKILRLGFSSLTRWPSERKLPEGFSPKSVIENAKYFKGLDIDKLHNKFINGKGVKIAYIDRGFERKHAEFSERNIEYIKQGGEDLHFHGSAVASRIIGKNIGIAPEAELIYYACSYTSKHGEKGQSLLNYIINELEALENILCRIKRGEKICCVGLSASIEYQIGKLSINENEKKALKERYDFIKEEYVKENVVILDSKKFSENFSYAFMIDTSGYYEDINNYENISKDNKSKICVIEAGKCIPLIYTNNAYKYENNLGCASWSIPQIASIFCLAKQLDEKLTYQGFVNLAQSTAIQNENGVKFIQPLQIVKELEKYYEGEIDI